MNQCFLLLQTAEAEMTSLNQQRKIEELEAQLNEAEDVITDLRAELKQVWHELEKTKNSQVQLLEGQIINQEASIEESAKYEVTGPFPIQEHECVTTCDVKNDFSKQNKSDDKCCNAIKQAELLVISNLEDYYGHNADLASIIMRGMRGKEPELYKNGCTQRIRALEGNLLDDKLLSRDECNGHFGVNNRFVFKDSDGDVGKLSTPSSRTKKMKIKKHVKRCRIQKGKTFSYLRSCFIPCCKTHIDENNNADKGAFSLPAIKPCAINKSKRTKRRRPLRVESSVQESSKSSFTLKQCSSVSNDAKCCEDEHDGKMKPVPHLADVESVHGSTSVSTNIRMVSEVGLGQETMERDNMKVEADDLPCTNTDTEDTKAYEENNGSSGQTEDSKLLKYTFHRKRKKESVGNPDGKTNSDKSTAKRRVEEKQNGASEPQKFTLTDESSRDSRRLAQVARQVCAKLSYYILNALSN